MNAFTKSLIALSAIAALIGAANAAQKAPAAARPAAVAAQPTGSYVTTKDGVQLYYKDWGPKDAQPVVFHHG
jgi:non-heme chloroperoxidase